MTLRDVLADVLVPHELIGHFQQRLKLHVDLALTGRRHFVMVRFDDDADLAHLVDHLAAQVVIGVGGTDRKVAALEARFVSEVRLLDARRVPRAFDRVDLVVAAVLVLLVAHLVEDEELRLGTDVARVGDARVLQVLLGLPRDEPRIARERLSGHRIDDVGDDADGGPGEERIEARGVGVGHREHVGFVDAHPAADRGAVESESLGERVLVQMFDGEGAVLPTAEHVDEFQVHHLGFVLLGEREEVIGRHGTPPEGGASIADSVDY